MAKWNKKQKPSEDAPEINPPGAEFTEPKPELAPEPVVETRTEDTTTVDLVAEAKTETAVIPAPVAPAGRTEPSYPQTEDVADWCPPPAEPKGVEPVEVLPDEREDILAKKAAEPKPRPPKPGAKVEDEEPDEPQVP